MSKIIFSSYFNIIEFIRWWSFNFDVTEIQILDNEISLSDEELQNQMMVIIDADRFEYNKNLNILNASGNVKINDAINNFIIFTDKIIYYKMMN